MGQIRFTDEEVEVFRTAMLNYRDRETPSDNLCQLSQSNSYAKSLVEHKARTAAIAQKVYDKLGPRLKILVLDE